MKQVLPVVAVLMLFGATAPPLSAQPSCVPSNTTLCLEKGRFEVEISWQDAQGKTGVGQAVPYATDDSGIFWFFDSSNWELMVKVLDGCALNHHFWVFSAATTNVAYTLRVTDTRTGQIRTYSNPQGRSAPAVTDTSAFGTCTAQDHASSLRSGASTRPAGGVAARVAGSVDAGASPCSASPTQSCLVQGRFNVQIKWTDGQGNTGSGQVVPFGTDNSALFWFFSSSNWEMLVKILDGCGLNQHFWVLSAAVTNVEYTLSVTDTFSGAMQQYSNAQGVSSPAILDTSAFSSCSDTGPPQVQFTEGAAATLTAAGQSAHLAVHVVSPDGSSIPGAAVTWSSSSPDLVNVQADGPLSAVVTASGPGPGSSTIIASFQGVVASAAVMVASTDPTTFL